MKMFALRRTETTDLEHLIFRDKMDDRFSKALSKLPEDFRTVVLLCDVDGFTYEEISNMLDVPIGTIRSRLHRGRNLLKTELYEHAKNMDILTINQVIFNRICIVVPTPTSLLATVNSPP